MNQIFPIILVLFLASCSSDSDENDDASRTCDNPIEVIGIEEKENASGYFVSFVDSIDVNVIAVEYLEKYENLEIYATFATSNTFLADSGSKTVEDIQCEEGVESIQYNLPEGIN